MPSKSKKLTEKSKRKSGTKVASRRKASRSRRSRRSKRSRSRRSRSRKSRKSMRSRRSRRSRSRSRRRKVNILNKFFNKIYIISLADQTHKFERVAKQFESKGIDVDHFKAVDGRCKKEGDAFCKEKLKKFKAMYDIKISNKKKLKLKELLPAASLTIGTILILREMVEKNWDHVLICEDDIDLVKDFEKKFKQGINEIGDYNWDILYLGCGTACGYKGVSYDWSRKNKHLSELGQIYGDEFYISNKNDLRLPCEECEEFSDHISVPKKAGGTWAYAYSLSGAKKVLKLLDDDAGNHIDQLLAKYMGKGARSKIKVLAFDPPIAYHEYIINRSASSIPWSW